MAALDSLKRSGIYDDFVNAHEWMNEDAHGRPAFLPWHRWFIYEFESALRRVASNPCITYVEEVP
jgi:tyrosinase